MSKGLTRISLTEVKSGGMPGKAMQSQLQMSDRNQALKAKFIPAIDKSTDTRNKFNPGDQFCLYLHLCKSRVAPRR